MKNPSQRNPHEPRVYDPRGGARTSQRRDGPWNPDLAGDYDRVAERYANAYFDELNRKPFDREVLDRFAQGIAGRVCDLGCGPGHVARYLHERGVDIFGVDFSPRMVDAARRFSPSIPFEVGDMLSLGIPSQTLGGVVSLYSIIHLTRDALAAALAEISRVLQPDGRLLLAFHRGATDVHAEEWFGEVVSLDATLFETSEVAGHLAGVGLEVRETLTRKPYEFELQTERVYILAARGPHE